LEERIEGSPQKKLLLSSGYKCASKEKKRKEKKKINQSKIGRKQKKIEKKEYRKVLRTRQCLNNVQNCQREKEKKQQSLFET